ncbi:MAG TPA: biopolymer transporter ExbD [Thermoanaerobaculia bacterium]|nr:biopolymer transporter ExbD [Thermoanaerobaculia bacterium]
MRAIRSTQLHADINVTPLVDVCLVLLIIFMVVTRVIVAGMPIQLPETRNGEALAKKKAITVTVKDDGTVYIDTLVTRKDQVENELRARHARGETAPIAVRGDKRVPYGEVMDVLDSYRAAGFEDVALISVKRGV